MKHHALLLWCAATDRTFRPVDLRGEPALAGKCIHCNTVLCVARDGRPISHATLEHIVPRTHGGTDALENLAIACGRCNGGKGVRLDPRPLSDPGLQAVIATLRARRAARQREPLAGLVLPPLPPASRDAARDPAPALEPPATDAGAEREGRGRGRGRARE